MIEKKLQIGIESIKKISMTKEEKESLLKNILSYSPVTTKPIRSPWNFFTFTSRQSRFVYYGVLPIVIIFLLTSGTVFGSQNSLPGDVLYPIKVNVVEPIRSALIPSKLAKAEYQASLATTRLTEAETLANQGKLDQPKQQEINKVLEKNISSFNKTVNILDQGNSDKNIDNIVTDFQANMNAHAQVLDLINSGKNTPNQAGDFQISQTARNNANIVGDNFKRRNKNNPGKYFKNKDQTQSLIDSTSTLLNQAASDPSTTEQTIINDTNNNLNQAKQLLNEADNQNQQGDQNNAYSSLLDSESAAKQANIFLRSELKFRKGNSNSDGNNNRGNEGGRNH